jgi:hypothetical protein
MHDAAIAIFVSSIVCTAVMVLLLTWSPGLAVASSGVLALSLGWLICLGIGLGERNFGILEAVALGAFLATLTTAIIRLSLQYALAQDRPDKPKQKIKEPKAKRDDLIMDTTDTGEVKSIKVPGNSIRPRRLRSQSADDEQEQSYLVDNRQLGATTKGLGYRLSPWLQDLDKNKNLSMCMAPWGSIVKGLPHGEEWLNVKDRYLPRKLGGVPVLTLQGVLVSTEEPELLYEAEEEDAYDAVYHKTPSDSDTYLDRMLTPDIDTPFWIGVVSAERLMRTATALRCGAKTILGSSVAGVIIACLFLLLRMEALDQVGLAVFCAAVTMPPAALGLLPVLFLSGLAPTRSKRIAFLEFYNWLRASLS